MQSNRVVYRTGRSVCFVCVTVRGLIKSSRVLRRAVSQRLGQRFSKEDRLQSSQTKKKKEHRSHPGFWFCRALVDISMENITTFRHFLNKTINHFIEKRTGASICNENNHLLQPWCSQLVSQKISAWELWEIALSYGRCIWNPWGFGKNNQRPNIALCSGQWK